MDDLVIRLALIVSALIVVWLATKAARRRSSGSVRRIDSTGLAKGVYLFSSTGCADCGSARQTLNDALGERFVELSWEQHPGFFDALGIGAVPATLIVDESGYGALWPGQPNRALVGLDP